MVSYIVFNVFFTLQVKLCFVVRSANRKLHDSNDGLRTALENSFSKYNRSLVCIYNFVMLY